MPESVDSSASPGPSGVDLAAEKLLKKKEKARRQWYTFVARVLAQVVGAAASVVSGCSCFSVGSSPHRPRPRQRRRASTATAPHTNAP